MSECGHVVREVGRDKGTPLGASYTVGSFHTFGVCLPTRSNSQRPTIGKSEHLNALIAVAALIGAVSGNPDSTAYDGAAGQTTITTPLLAQTAEIDGRLDDDVWSQAALLLNFSQYDPVEGVAASQRTEAMVFLTDDALYVGIRAFDDEPGGVRASITERDEVVRKDDYIRVVLDTFNDERRGFVFVVNPYGIQQDGVWFEGRQGGRGGGFGGPPIDWNPDLIWQSYGRVEEWGYAVEMRIPLKSIRFPTADVQEWGFQIMRRVERNGYESSWAPISRNQTSQLPQSGHLANLRGLDAGLFLELNPVLTSSLSGGINSTTGDFERGSRADDIGVNLTYGITSNLTLDGTINPDFSQVEADAGQIAVNERFALFFPEKRPFFLQGTEIFGMPKRLVYTRSVANPIAGAKLTGKMGDFGVGYLGAVDEVNDSTNVWVNLLRLRRDVGAGSNVGLVFTDRTHSGDEYNRLVGADARILVGRRHALTLLGAASKTGEGVANAYSGGMWSARFERTGRGFSYNAELEDVSPEFKAGSGFVNRVGDVLWRSRLSYNWYGDRGALIERWGPSLETNAGWQHNDFWSANRWEEGQMQVGFSTSFRGNVTIFGSYFRQGFNIDADRYAGLFSLDALGEPTPYTPDQQHFQGLDGFRIFLFANSFQRVRLRGGTEWRETPIFYRSLGVPAEPASLWSADMNFTLFPTNSIQVEAGGRHQRLSRRSTGEEYSSATLPRISAQYQLTRSLFVRLVGEYAAQSTNALRGPAGFPLARCSDSECTPIEGSDANDVYFEALLSYEPTPGTVFFAGYSREMEDFDTFEFRELTPQRDGFFMKVSYRFRN